MLPPLQAVAQFSDRRIRAPATACAFELFNSPKPILFKIQLLPVDCLHKINLHMGRFEPLCPDSTPSYQTPSLCNPKEPQTPPEGTLKAAQSHEVRGLIVAALGIWK